MNDLIKAFQIFQKYVGDGSIHCEHDELYVPGLTQEAVSQEDQAELDKLGFFWSNEYDCWMSFQ